MSAPRAVAGHLFYQRLAAGQSQAVLYRHGGSILEANTASAAGTVAQDWCGPGRDGRPVSYGYSVHGDGWIFRLPASSSRSSEAGGGRPW